MPLSVTRESRICVLLVAAFLLCLCFAALAQRPNDSLGLTELNITGVPALGPETITPAPNSRMQSGNTCNTNTFYLQLPAAAGESIQLCRLQTFPSGNYLLAGTAKQSNGFQEGILVLMGKDGSLLQQRRFRMGAAPVSITDAAVYTNSNFYITGTVADGSNNIFLACLKEDFSVTWTKTILQSALPEGPKLAVLENQTIALAVQVQGTIACGLYNKNGQPLWQNSIVPASLTNLVGINMLNYGTLGVVTNCVSNAGQIVQVAEINVTNGNVNSSSFKGDGNIENKAMALSNFAGRMSILGVTTDGAGGFSGCRDLLYSPSLSETVHQFISGTRPDFTSTAAVDNAADAMGYFLPASQQLLFIKQYAAYSTEPEFARKYSITGGAAIAGITRSFDGGFLFGINTQGKNAVILMKTDSLGLLPGCGEETVSITAIETIGVTNKAVSAVRNSASPLVANNALQSSAASYTGVYSCRENTCPPEPLADTCLSTYFKTFRSGSYADIASRYFLLKDNKQLLSTVRYDRVYGNGNQLTYGLKLLDEKGALLKAVDIYNDSSTQTFTSWKMDEQQVMLVAYSPVNGAQRFNFTLVNDLLQKIWTRTIITGSDFHSDGIGISDIHKDRQGNFYVIATRSGFPPVKPAIFVYKMDAAGNHLWTSVYENSNDYFSMASITSTETSIIIVIEASGNGGLSLSMNKQSGLLQNSYRFNNTSTGSIYTRILRYAEGSVLYAGNDKNGNFLMGVFDSTAKPLKLRYADAPGSTVRAATVKDGKLFASFNFYDGTGTKEVLLKADTGLTVEFIRQYDYTGNASGIQVSDAGNIYVGSVHFYGGINGSYADNFIKKYDSEGLMGTCAAFTPAIRFIDLPTNTTLASMNPITRSYPEDAFSINLLPSNALLNINNILCSSTPQCRFIKLQDPGPVCRLDTIYTMRFSKDISCTLRPQLKYDTGFIAVQSITDSSVLIRFKKTGNSWLKATLNAGCQLFSDSLLLRANTSPAALNLGADALLCAGDSLVLHAGSGYAQYAWQNGTADSVFMVTVPGKYVVEVTNTCGEKATDSISIAQAIIPLLELGPSVNVCLHDTLQLQVPDSFAVYRWTPAALAIGQGAAVKIVTATDATIQLQATTQQGCMARDSISLHLITARPVNLGADTSFCAADSLRLNAGLGYLSYQWSNGTGNPTLTIKQPGIYWVKVKDVNGCAARDTLQVPQVFTHPRPALGPDRDICAGTPLILDAGSYTTYLWNDGSRARVKTITATGMFTITVTDNNSCPGTDSITISNINPAPTAFLQNTDSICNYGKLTIVPQKTYRSYQWSDGSSQSSVTIVKPGLYTLKVTDANGCSGTDSILVVKKECMSGFYAPSAFSPNGDRLNDAFHPLLFGPVLHYSLQVYNRFGQQVYYSTDPDQSWNGWHKGKPCDAGAYIWQCSYQFAGGKPAYEKGLVMLVK